MSRKLLSLIVITCLVSMASGCRNCSLFNPCANQCGGFANNQLLPAPPTGSLQIPSLGQNQPYYNNGVPTTARQPNYLINPNSAAPTPATNTPTLAPQQGWRPVGSNSYSLNSPTSPAPTTNNGVQPRSVLQNTPTPADRAPTGFASQSGSSVLSSNQPLTQTRPVTTQVAANTTPGLSYKDNVNYQSTQIDERRDATRLAATDATAVRAPTSFSTVPGIQVAQAAPVYGQVVPAGQNLYAPPTRFTQTQFVQPQQPGIVAGTVAYGQPYNVYPYSGSAPAVLAQSTTTYNPQNVQTNSFDSTGWRDRDLTTRR